MRVHRVGRWSVWGPVEILFIHTISVWVHGHDDVLFLRIACKENKKKIIFKSRGCPLMRARATCTYLPAICNDYNIFTRFVLFFFSLQTHTPVSVAHKRALYWRWERMKRVKEREREREPGTEWSYRRRKRGLKRRGKCACKKKGKKKSPE